MLAALSSGASLPAGQIAAFAHSSVPSGWLVCDGATVSRTAYAALFAAIGTTYGAGDGSTTFNVPDLRGEFVRGVDASRSVGSKQTDGIKKHRHMLSYSSTPRYVSPFGKSTYRFDKRFSAVYDKAGEASNMLPFSSSGEGCGTETRPRNVAMLYCIKF